MRTLKSLPGIPLKKLAPLFGLSMSGLRNSICVGRFPIPTFLDGGRRYADRQAVKEHFAAARTEGLAALSDAATPPDWRIIFDLGTMEENHAALQGAADELKAKGATHARATIVPETGKLFVEGWRVRPAKESPLPTARDCVEGAS